MNKYVRSIVYISCGILKISWLKIFRAGSFSGPAFCLVSPHTEITIDRGAKLKIGNSFKMRDGAKIRVRKGGTCFIGNNTSINSNNIITCHESIEIGDNCQFSPNVYVYDHDHDFRDAGGLKAMKYKTSPIKIGNSVWIGANTVILRGSDIGDNCVIGAGSVIKGKYEKGSIIVQKRDEKVRKIE